MATVVTWLISVIFAIIIVSAGVALLVTKTSVPWIVWVALLVALIAAWLMAFPLQSED